MGNRVSTVSDLLTIHIGGDRTATAHKKNAPRAANNRIKSTKYTVITFLPQNLLEQFRRIANFYFLVMVVISTVIDSPVSPLTSLVPLVFVIAVTAAKQGYEDFLRFRADNMVNYSFVTVIRDGKQMDVRSQDVLQGDLVKAARDCDVPCDLVLLMSSDAGGKVHITTANLDGETNLKTLSVPRGLPDCGMENLHTLGIIECEQPRTDLYTFNGRIELSSATIRKEHARLSAFSASDVATTELPATTLILNAANSAPLPAIPLMADNLLLRGSRIKNTEWAIGCAVYTGQNTKLSLNSRLTRNKMSSSEKYVNKFLVFFLLLLIAMVIVSYFLKRYFDMHASEHNIYLGDPPQRYQISMFLQDFFSYLILFNYLIPISLYVTIEFHKFFGAFFMEWDAELYDADTNQPFIVNTSDLNEELGQVKYLFSDKTGTLTKNEMILQQCSIAGRMYTMTGSGIQERHRINPIKIGEFRDEHMAFFQTLATCHTVQVAGTGGDVEGADAGGGNAEIDGVPLLGESVSFPTRDMSSGESFPDVHMRNNAAVTFGDIAEETNGSVVSGNVDAATSVMSLKKDPSSTDELDFHNRLQQLIPTEYLDDEPPSTGDKQQPPRTSINKSTNTNPRYAPGASSPRPIHRESGVQTTRVKLQRPMSTIYPSEKERTAAAGEVNGAGHRRTQSYVPPTTYSRQVQTDARRQSKTNSLTRYTAGIGGESVANLREYYVAPAFNRATLVERKESTRRRNEIRSVVQKLDYQASSPDEKALVEACAKVGFLYTGEQADTMTVRLQQFRSAYTGKRTIQPTTLNNNNNKNNNDTDDGRLLFDRLSTIEFTSDRKRMSTVLRDRRDGQLWLLTKGAESHVLPLCEGATAAPLREATLRHINEFARTGLRTLAVARRRLTAEEYARYSDELTTAATSMAGDRKELMGEVNARLEQNLELLGATAVEDALQDDVRDTLESLRFAGIKVWVLTGDKVETALNIALSCGHIPEQSERYFITECVDKEQLDQHLDVLESTMNSQPDDLFALLIDGASLAVALREARNRFRDTSMRCRAVLCCRLSPLQKCEVVQLIKTAEGRPITGAIGDGANDVSMIQEAHVGLGIVGKEGRQAARCADYAFANFSMLKRVLLVHGYYYSQRLSVLVLYFFYKNLVFMLIQFYFQMNSMFSTESVYDSLFLTLYNVVYTSVPVLLLSLTEKLHTEERLLRNPPLYAENAGNRRFYWKNFVGWMSLAVYHSAVIYMAAFLVWSTNPAILPDPYTVNFYCFGTFLMHNVVVLVNLKLWLVAKYQSNWFIVSVVGSIVLFIVSTLVYNLFLPKYDGDMLWVYITLLGSPTVWLLFMFITVGALLPDYAIKSCHDAFGLRVNGIFPGARSTEKRRARKLFSYRRRRTDTDVESTNL